MYFLIVSVHQNIDSPFQSGVNFFPQYVGPLDKIGLLISLRIFTFPNCISLCRLTFETAFKLRGGPSLVFAHSLGNNVFRYFLEWLKLEIAPKHYIQWLDQHIHAYFAVGMIELCAFVTL